MKRSKFAEARVAFAIKPAGAVALCWGFVDSFLPAAGRPSFGRQGFGDQTIVFKFFPSFN